MSGYYKEKLHVDHVWELELIVNKIYGQRYVDEK